VARGEPVGQTWGQTWQEGAVAKREMVCGGGGGAQGRGEAGPSLIASVSENRNRLAKRDAEKS
jgi:hypothetical protein